MKTKKYGLIGKDIDYSFSRKYFTDKFEKLKLQYTYVNFDLAAIREFSELLEVEQDKVHGFNVTIPYKQSIIPYLDSISKKAQKIGAVNTIKIDKKGKLKGFNTDWYGFYHSLKPLLKYSNKKVLILGTGGASKAVEYAVKKLKLKYKFVSRIKQDDNFVYSELTEDIIRQYTVIINTTPVGTFPNVDVMPDIPLDGITAKHIVYDLIYNPEQTQLLQEASRRGATVKNGEEMLLLQAEKAWSIWNKSFKGD